MAIAPGNRQSGWLIPALRLAVWLAVLAVRPVTAAFTIELQAVPAQIPADGLSETTVTAEVREDGSLVASGVTVNFETTQGSFFDLAGEGRSGTNLQVPVQGGRAKVTLRSTTFETTTLVTAFLVGQQNSRSDRLEIVFGSQTGPSQTYDNIIRVKGDYIWYGPEPAVQIMEIIGNAVVTYQGIEVRANLIQLDLQDYLLLAKDYHHGVVLANSSPPYDEAQLDDSSKPPYRGEALAMDLRSQTGAIFSAQLGETIYFSGRSLERGEDRAPSPGLFDLFELDEVKIWIEAKSAAIYPYEKIRFDRAKFFLNGTKVFSLPYYFESLGYSSQLGPAITQVVNYSTQDGLIVDFPWYFNVGDRHTNELRLTRGIRTGLFGRTTGFQLSYNHHADLPGDRGEWDFTIDDLLGGFGVQYARQERFGPQTFSTFSLAWPRHSDVYSNATLYAPAGPGNLSVNLNVDYLNGFQGVDSGLTANSNVVWQSSPVELGGELSLTGSLGAGYSHSVSERNFWRQSGAMSLTRRPWRLGQTGTIQPYMGVRFSNTVNGNQEVAYTFNTTWRQQVSNSMSWSLGYTFDTAWNSQFKVPDRHVLTANWQLYSQGMWSGYAYGNYNLVDNSLSASALLDYTFAKHWGVAGQSLYQSSNAGSFSESEVWFYRILGARELSLRYSIERSRLFFEIDNHF